MALLVWAMMGIALWHFAVFVPDRFWGGIVGAFVGGTLGAVIFGLAIHAFSVPSRDDTTVVNALEAIPGALLGLGLLYFIGARKEDAEVAAAQQVAGLPPAR